MTDDEMLADLWHEMIEEDFQSIQFEGDYPVYGIWYCVFCDVEAEKKENIVHTPHCYYQRAKAIIDKEET